MCFDSTYIISVYLYFCHIFWSYFWPFNDFSICGLMIVVINGKHLGTFLMDFDKRVLLSLLLILLLLIVLWTLLLWPYLTGLIGVNSWPTLQDAFYLTRHVTDVIILTVCWDQLKLSHWSNLDVIIQPRWPITNGLHSLNTFWWKEVKNQWLLILQGFGFAIVYTVVRF